MIENETKCRLVSKLLQQNQRMPQIKEELLYTPRTAHCGPYKPDGP